MAATHTDPALDLQASAPEIPLALGRAGVTGVAKAIRISHEGREKTIAAQIFTLIYFAFFLLMPWYTRMEKTKPEPDRVTWKEHH